MVGRFFKVAHLAFLKREARHDRFTFIPLGLVLGWPEHHHVVPFRRIDYSPSAPTLYFFGFTEEGSKIIEILLRPVIEGMIVTHRAADPHPKENL